AQRRIWTQRDALGVRRYLLEHVEAVVSLGIAVDDPRSLQKPLVLELLGERRLAGPERTHAEDRRVAVAVRALPQVEPDRLPRARERVPEVIAAPRSGGMRRGRHHGRHLLRGQRVVIADDPGALTRQVLEEQLQLVAQRPVQADLPVCAPAHLDALLQLLIAFGPHGYGERGPQQRRTGRGLQVCEQVARLLRALVAEV